MEIQEERYMLSSRSICGPDDQMCVDVRTSSMNALQKKEAVSSVYEHEIKVRKPYTISKQRERWTKEEHDKFLEALKLYGRAWRQIEEHIGTKTAVQIRSHAQKFFSKVAREPSHDGLGTVKAIEIPPPRPKRKPMHPYPRKLVQSPSLKMPALEQPEWSSLSFPSVSDQENRSPTSVLTAFRSDTMGSSVSTLPSTCASPVSPAGSNLDGFLLSDKENGCKFSIASAEEDKSPSSVSTDVAMREKANMEVKLGADKDDTLKEDQSMEVQGTSFKLFGRTVLLNDYQKPFCSSDGSLFRYPKLSAMDMDCHIPVQPVHHIAVDGTFPLALRESQCGPSPVRAPPMFFCLPSNEDSISTTTGANVWPLPWRWAFWGEMPAPASNPDTTKYKEDPWKSCAGATDEKVDRQESSWTGSNTASNGDVVDSQSVEHVKEPALPSLRRSTNSAFISVKANPAKIARGFLPYKRCLAENEIRHPLATGEDRDSEGLQLCL